MICLETIWAKSNPIETLKQHTIEVIMIWEQLRTRYKEVISNQEFWAISFWAVVYHDFGKICNRFQEMIKPDCHITQDDFVRHEFFSGIFLYLNNREFYEKHIESLVAVFGHHKAFNQQGFVDRVSNNLKIKFHLDEECINEFIDFANSLAKEKGIEPLKFQEQWKLMINKVEYDQLIKVFKGKIYDSINKDGILDENNRKIYIYQKAILNISDWTASGHLKLENGINYNEKYLAKHIIEKLITDGKVEMDKNFDFRKFQKQSLSQGNIIAIAPTGSGKTEASLLWASSKKDWEKIIYLLPTRVTSNAIFDRLTGYFGEEYTQLIHSSARQYVKENYDDTYDQNKYFRDKSFFRNINVCTVDQLLTLGFNLGYWEVKTFHMLNARVIIDEIHLYSPYTLGLIISTIKYLNEHFSTQFYIMTATMPQNLLQLLKKTLGEVKIIRDQELLDHSRNRFEVRDNFIVESLKEIIVSIKKGKKVLVVVNTVDKAIELYDDLKDIAIKSGYDCVCYHSRFIKMDRAKKEKQIFALDEKDNGCVLIATQVVEVSLDIDFDVLYTENAPIDAIIQRAGRVNRKRKKGDTKVIIFPHYKISKEKIYDAENVLEDTFKVFSNYNAQSLSEKQLNNLVDEVYKGLDIETNEIYQEGLQKHTEIQHSYNFIKDLTSDAKVFTREGLDTVPVIPDKFEECLKEERDKDVFSNHELSISTRRFNSGKHTKNDFGFIFFKSEYNDERGLTFIAPDKNVGNTY